MTAFRTVIIHQEDDEGELDTIFVVPDTTSVADIIAESDDAVIMCQTFSDSDADLIVCLLNSHYARKEMN